MYEIAVCDDQLSICEEIKQMVTELLLKRDIDIRVHIYTTGKDLLDEGIVFDIMFLDIELENESGLVIAKEYSARRQTKIIFLTSHIEEMPNGYKVRAFRFLTKPVNLPDFEEAVWSAISDMQKDKKFIVTDKDGEYIIRASEIMYVEAQQRSTGIRTMERFARSSIPFRDMTKELEMIKFYNTHKSYIANMDYICKIDQLEIVLVNEERIKISRLKKSDFMDSFYSYIRSRANGN
ncbi:MAG: LytTR family DNA-binding domain-containing protein [Mobilitalea sp.]